jgi:hypothetical protein
MFMALGRIRGEALAEWPIELRIVDDDEIDRPDESLDRVEVDRLAGDYIIGDAGQGGDVSRDGNVRLAERSERAHDVGAAGSPYVNASMASSMISSSA